jgi:hypothetical protein
MGHSSFLPTMKLRFLIEVVAVGIDGVSGIGVRGVGELHARKLLIVFRANDTSAQAVEVADTHEGKLHAALAADDGAQGRGVVRGHGGHAHGLPAPHPVDSSIEQRLVYASARFQPGL